MAVNLSIALASGQTGFVPDNTGLVKEYIIVTGSSSSANDTGTYTTIMKQPQFVICGDVSYSISGQVVTLTDEVGLGNAVTAGEILGYA